MIINGRLVISCIGSLLLTIVLYFYSIFFKTNILVQQDAKTLIIPYGCTFQTVHNTLQQTGYIKNSLLFHHAALLMRYNTSIKPGHYQLSPNMNNYNAIHILRRGLQKPVKIVLNNINTKQELITQLTKNIGVTTAEFHALLHDNNFLSQYGVTSENCICIFIPNTYEVYWTITAKNVFHVMYKAYQRFWNKERLLKAEQIKIDPIQVSILASIIQKESNKSSEWPTIAGVYINRLKKKWRLCADPTLLYALRNSRNTIKRVLKKDTKIDSPYNTYYYAGLPPGPITLPSIACIDAVLNYEKHHYLFFSAKEDLSGYHYFTSNLEDHLKHARRYQKTLNRSGIIR